MPVTPREVHETAAAIRDRVEAEMCGHLATLIEHGELTGVAVALAQQLIDARVELEVLKAIIF